MWRIFSSNHSAAPSQNPAANPNAPTKAGLIQALQAMSRLRPREPLPIVAILVVVKLALVLPLLLEMAFEKLPGWP